jgi:ABC-type nitrate/sulfonate/bicarbonate transport system substrate-binding protein
MVFGDNVERHPRWVAYRKLDLEYAAAVRAAGGKVDVIDLPDVGIKGNSHMVMMDRNNAAVADVIQRWLVAQGLTSEASTTTSAPAAATAQKLRVAVNVTTIETVPVYLAAEGVDAIELSGGGIPALTEGKADAATNAETQAVLRSTARPDIRVILTVAEYGYRVVARRSAGISAASDLRGKKIATSLNSSAHFYLAKTLRAAGLSERDVTVVGLAPPDMPSALVRGEVDAISIWEPAAESAAQRLAADAVIINGPPYRERFNLNTTAAATADPAKRTALVNLLRSIIRSSREVRERPEPAQQLIARKLDIPLQLVTTSWNLFRFPASLPDDLLDSMLEQEPWMAEKQNRAVRPREAIASLIDATLLRDALASR